MSPKSNGWGKGLGFHLIYKAHECRHDSNNGICMKGGTLALCNVYTFLYFAIMTYVSDCGGSFSDTSGFITSPSFPNQYPNNADCIYIITEPQSAYVLLRVISLDIRCHTDKSDYIDVRDGASEDSPLIGRFCGDGSNVPAQLHTTQAYLRIR